MKNIYPKSKNPFAGKKVLNFKKAVTYPSNGSIRYRIQLDKNGQVYDINQSFATVIKDADTKKKYVKVTIGERPQELYWHIKGRPFNLAKPWIDEAVALLNSSSAD